MAQEEREASRSFDKFTERARIVLQSAHDSAIALHSQTIEVKHILLGLINDADGPAVRVLDKLGVNRTELKEKILSKEPESQEVQCAGARSGLSTEAKKLIELAVDEARKLNHSYVGTEHLLFGLIRLETSPLLVETDITYDDAKAKYDELWKTMMPSQTPREPADSFRFLRSIIPLPDEIHRRLTEKAHSQGKRRNQLIIEILTDALRDDSTSTPET